ncbi:MAG: permease [Lunatimonas sp.]|uniref:AEC family transporter n=1 Tax=Lunatimonas sp. TaxID=2060141 RepID=UPI00263B6485|nr:permease [Lunatimonas sp.]MCC5938549.1 permease [Lunatimonas sp.]
MNIAVQKTLSLLILLVIGFLLRGKLGDPAQQKGLKTLILTVALPAIIFVALLKAEVQPDLLMLPILAIGFNVVLYFILKYTLPFFGIEKDSSTFRTYLLLFPSLAPGLSCFPFLIEYLGDDALAWGALADIGNKIFVLIIAYLIAMRWYFKINTELKTGNGDKLKSLLISLINEPINIVIVLALVLLSLDIHLTDLPTSISTAITTLSNLMTPLVLIFIGIAVIFNWKQIRKIAGLLMVRAGLTFVLSGLVLLFAPQLSFAAIMVLVVFPQSAISFWPFAHMASITAMEQKQENKRQKTFDMELAVNILAVSMPFATVIMLTVFSFGELFTSSSTLFTVGFGLMALGIIKPVLSWFNIIEYKPSFEKEGN